jgi:uncharacterized protein YxeA
MIVVVVIVIVAVAAVAAFMVLNNNNNNSDSDKKYVDIDVSTVLQVYGNANGDAVIDSHDIEIVNDVISGKKKSADYKFVDANQDGKVDKADVELITKMMKHEPCTVYVVGLENDPVNQIETVVKVNYPVTKSVLFATNMNATVLYVGGSSNVVGIFNSTYPNFESALLTDKIKLLGGTSLSVEDGWAEFTALAANGGVDAFFADYSKIDTFTDKYVDDLNAAGIPLLIFATTDAKAEVSAALTIGFLFGEEVEKKSQKYAEISWSVFDKIDSISKTIPDADKTSVISISMGSRVVAINSPNYDTVRQAGGIPYYEINEDFKKQFDKTGTTAIKTGETLANYGSADVIWSVRSIDGKSDDLKSVMLNDAWDKYGKYFEDLENYKQLYYINNVLPGSIKLAYLVEHFYPDKIEAGYGDKIFNEVKAVCEYLNGCTVENTFTDMTYQDYVNAGGSKYIK